MHVPPDGARTIAALLTPPATTLRTHPSPARVRSLRMGRKLKSWTTVDRRHETLRTGMQDLFHDIDMASSRTGNILSIGEM